MFMPDEDDKPMEGGPQDDTDGDNAGTMPGTKDEENSEETPGGAM